MDSINWQQVDVSIFTAAAKVEVELHSGRLLECNVNLRIDGRTGEWRVDHFCPVLRFWVGIDGFRRFETPEAAKEYASRWLEAAVTTKTLSPNLN